MKNYIRTNRSARRRARRFARPSAAASLAPLLLSAALLLCAVGCSPASPAPAPTEQTAPPTVTETPGVVILEPLPEDGQAPDTAGLTPTLKDLVLAENEYAMIRVDGVKSDPAPFDFALLLTLKSKVTAGTLVFSTAGAAVNGVASDPDLYVGLEPGEEQQVTVGWRDSALREAQAPYTRISLPLTVFDRADWLGTDLLTVNALLYPYGEQYDWTCERVDRLTDVLLVEAPGCRVLLTEVKDYNDRGAELVFLLVNRTAGEVLAEASAFTLNGTAIDLCFAKPVPAASYLYASAYISDADMKSAGLKRADLTELGFTLTVRDLYITGETLGAAELRLPVTR